MAIQILAARRTPVGKAGGVFAHVPPEQLGAAALRACLDAIPQATPGGVILANAIGPGGNLARLTLLTAGLPAHLFGLTVDAQCGGGLAAIGVAADRLTAGGADMLLAGGAESTSLAPTRIGPDGQPYARARFSPPELGDPDMGPAAENVARHVGVTRAESDAWALLSYQRAWAARTSGELRAELTPVEAPAGAIAVDELPNRLLTAERLAALPPVFGGTVTPGNASRYADGAAAVLLATPEAAHAADAPPLAIIRGWTLVGVDPNLPGLGPVPASMAVCRAAGVSLAEIDLWEINEAYAGQTLSCVRSLDLDPARVNRWGGAVAQGHPYGASGAICLVRLVHGLRRTGTRLGVATLGIGGGLGVAMLVEREA